MTDRTSFAGFALREIAGVPLLWRADDRFKTCRLVLQARRPLDERAAARSVLPALLLHGTETDPDRPALARRMELLYGAAVGPSTVKVGESHVLRLTLDIVAGRFLPGRPPQIRDGARFLSDYVARPRLDGDGFPQATFERERRHAVDAARALIDDRSTWAHQQALAHACAGEPMAIPEFGSIEALQRLERHEPELARRDFLRHGPLWIVASGAFDEGEVVAAAEEIVAALPERAPEDVPPPAGADPRPPRRIVERLPLQQSKLVLVFRFPPEQRPEPWVARRLFAGMFGGGPHGRLFREVREKRSLAYYASAALERHKGLLVVHIGLDESAAQSAEDEVLRQFEELRAGRFDDVELETARAHYLSAIAAVDDSVASACQFVSDQWLLGAGWRPQDLAEHYLTTDRAAVAAAAEGVWLDLVYLLAPEEGAS